MTYSNKMIFSKEKYLSQGEDYKADYERMVKRVGTNGNWIDLCDGMEVEDGRIGDYHIQNNWCVKKEGQ